MGSNKNLTMKLLIDANTDKVLFGEAGKDVVDFLFGLLNLPVGTVAKLLTADRMVGSMGGIYKSVEAMDDTYLCSNQIKASLLDPAVVTSASLSNVLLLPPTSPKRTSNYRFSCTAGFAGTSCRSSYTGVSGTLCPTCTAAMATVKAVDGRGEGYVKGVVTYSVMDDLTITPMSTISSIAMLNKLHVKDLSALREKTVTLDSEKGLELLRCSLQSKTVLTDVFLPAVKKE